MLFDQASYAAPRLAVVLGHVPSIVRRKVPRPDLEIEGTASRSGVAASIGFLHPGFVSSTRAADWSIPIAPTDLAFGVGCSDDPVLGLRHVFRKLDAPDIGRTVSTGASRRIAKSSAPNGDTESGQVSAKVLDLVLIPVASQRPDTNRGPCSPLTDPLGSRDTLTPASPMLPIPNRRSN